MDSLTLREMFVPMLGFIAAVIATSAAVLTAVFGPFKRLRLPVESVQGLSRGVLNMVLFAPFLVSFLLIDLAWARPALLVSLVALVAAFICYQNYGGLLNLHPYTKPRARRFLWFEWNTDEVIIGGTELTPDAAARKAQTRAPEQRLLAEAEYKPDVSAMSSESPPPFPPAWGKVGMGG
jgi:MFS family permease